MIRPARPTFSLLRAALLGTTALVLCGPHPVFARVGVTSATNGDPLGKPPQEAERILRIGIDVQANEAITTGANDRAHLVFLDGTSLTVGPNAQLTIDKFVYDPNTKLGELAVSATQGVLRLVGGKISKTNPITITTPSSTIGIRGGICVLDIKPNNTTSTFLFGNNMTVSGNGGTQNVTRPGSQVTTNAGAPPRRTLESSSSSSDACSAMWPPVRHCWWTCRSRRGRCLPQSRPGLRSRLHRRQSPARRRQPTTPRAKSACA